MRYTETFIRKYTIALMQHIKAIKPLQILLLDFFGTITKSYDNKEYILTMIDYFAKYS